MASCVKLIPLLQDWCPLITCYCLTSSVDGDVVEQVISQRPAEQEEPPVRQGSLLDEAIRRLQEDQLGAMPRRGANAGV